MIVEVEGRIHEGGWMTKAWFPEKPGVFRKLCQSKSFELVGSQNSFFVG
jgi:hypothetical protein